MSKVDKKEKEVTGENRISRNRVENGINKKDSSTREINVAERQSEIIKLKVELLNIV